MLETDAHGLHVARGVLALDDLYSTVSLNSSWHATSPDGLQSVLTKGSANLLRLSVIIKAFEERTLTELLNVV